MRCLTTIAVAACALAIAACGEKKIDVAKYTCGDFQTSLRTKDDNTGGQFIRKLREQAKLGQNRTAEERTMTLAIFFACQGKPKSYAPADKAVRNAKDLKAGKQVAPAPAPKKKK